MAKTTTMPPAIILGISGNALGIARSLGRRGVHVIAISDNFDTPNASCRYIREKWRHDGNEESLVDMLLDLSGALSERPVLFPIRDATVLAIADRLDELRERYRLAMPGADTLKKTLCKTTFDQLAQSLGYPTARSFSVNSVADMEAIVQDLRFPCILKPEFRSDSFLSSATAKAFFAETHAQLMRQYSDFATAAPEVVVQEYIPGGDEDLYFCFQYYDKHCNPVASICGKKIRQWPPLCGSTASCEVVDIEEIESLSTEFFQSIRYSGPCSMEFKRDPRNGTIYFIEPTVGRLDWNNGFAEGNGLPIPFIAFCDMIGQDIPNFRRKKSGRRWIRWSADYRSAMHYYSIGKMGLVEWLNSLMPPITWATWCLDDPAPFFLIYYQRVRRKIKRFYHSRFSNA